MAKAAYCGNRLGKAEMNHLRGFGACDDILVDIQCGIEPFNELRRETFRHGLAVADPAAKMIDIKVYERVFPLR